MAPPVLATAPVVASASTAAAPPTLDSHLDDAVVDDVSDSYLLEQTGDSRDDEDTGEPRAATDDFAADERTQINAGGHGDAHDDEAWPKGDAGDYDEAPRRAPTADVDEDEEITGDAPLDELIEP